MECQLIDSGYTPSSPVAEFNDQSGDIVAIVVTSFIRAKCQGHTNLEVLLPHVDQRCCDLPSLKLALQTLLFAPQQEFVCKSLNVDTSGDQRLWATVTVSINWDNIPLVPL